MLYICHIYIYVIYIYYIWNYTCYIICDINSKGCYLQLGKEPELLHYLKSTEILVVKCNTVIKYIVVVYLRAIFSYSFIIFSSFLIGFRCSMCFMYLSSKCIRKSCTRNIYFRLIQYSIHCFVCKFGIYTSRCSKYDCKTYIEEELSMLSYNLLYSSHEVVSNVTVQFIEQHQLTLLVLPPYIKK